MAFMPLKEYKMTLSGSSDRVALLPITGEVDSQNFQVRIFATANMTCKFGSSTVTADATVTSKALVDGNFSVYANVVEAFNFKNNLTYIAAIGTGDITITVGVLEP